jgi:hypothetical protein
MLASAIPSLLSKQFERPPATPINRYSRKANDVEPYSSQISVSSDFQATDQK